MRPEPCKLVVSVVLAAAVAAGGCASGPAPWMMAERAPQPGAPRPFPAMTSDLRTDVALFDEAVALASELKYAEAAARFRAVLGRFEMAGDGRKTAETLFWLGFCHEKLGDAGSARQYYSSVLSRYPAAPAARRAGEHLARLAAAETAPPAKR